MKTDSNCHLLGKKTFRKDTVINTSDKYKKDIFKTKQEPHESKYQNKFHKLLMYFGYDLSKFEQTVLLCYSYLERIQEFNFDLNWNKRFNHCSMKIIKNDSKMEIDFTYNNSNFFIYDKINNQQAIIPSSVFEKINFNDIDDRAVEFIGNKYLKKFFNKINQEKIKHFSCKETSDKDEEE